MDAPIIPQLVEVTLAGGLGYVIKSAWDYYVKRQDAKTPEAQQALQLTQSNGQVDILARVNAELESDNDRLRKIIRDTDIHIVEQKRAWDEERSRLMTELETMRANLINMMGEIDVLQSKLRALTEPLTD